jgi:hypothetical protein
MDDAYVISSKQEDHASDSYRGLLQHTTGQPEDDVEMSLFVINGAARVETQEAPLEGGDR